MQLDQVLGKVIFNLRPEDEVRVKGWYRHWGAEECSRESKTYFSVQEARGEKDHGIVKEIYMFPLFMAHKVKSRVMSDGLREVLRGLLSHIERA